MNAKGGLAVSTLLSLVQEHELDAQAESKAFGSAFARREVV